MKLRIVASSRDLIIFAIFAVFLLYVVALGVLNLPQLAGEGTFYGLNPIEAFSSDYILFTVVFYLLALGGLVMNGNLALVLEFHLVVRVDIPTGQKQTI